MYVNYAKRYLEESYDEIKFMTKEEAQEGMKQKQIRFAEFYVKTYNQKTAAIKAGYAPTSAHLTGWRLKREPKIQRYIAWLKFQVSEECHVTALDVLDQYIKIAFADITEYVCLDSRGKLKVIDDLDKVDGQIVKKISEGRDGITVEMADKMAALAKLENYFDLMPKDWRQVIEERKLELAREKLELEKKKFGEFDEVEDDGFIEALKGAAEQVWDDEKDIEIIEEYDDKETDE